MKRFQVQFYFDQGNTITNTVKATSKESALSSIPTNGTYEIADEENGSVYRITVNLVKYIIVTELEA